VRAGSLSLRSGVWVWRAESIRQLMTQAIPEYSLPSQRMNAAEPPAPPMWQHTRPHWEITPDEGPDVTAICAHRHADAAVRDLTVSTNGHPSDIVIPLHACAHKADILP
jgi:hypothetical protein